MITIYNKQKGGGLAIFEHQQYRADQQRTFDDQLGTWFCDEMYIPSFQLFSPYNIQTIQVWAMRNTEVKLFDLTPKQGWVSRYTGSEWIITASDDIAIRSEVFPANFAIAVSGTMQLRFIDTSLVLFEVFSSFLY